MKRDISFKSGYSYIFYLSVIVVLIVFGFSMYSFSNGNLDGSNFLILNLGSCTMALYTLRFDCEVTIKFGEFRIRYFLPFNKSINIDTNEIIEVDKHEDYTKRGYKKLFIKTKSDSFLIKYNISDQSDERLVFELDSIRVENSKHLPIANKKSDVNS